MTIQWIVAGTFWLSYLLITLASVVTISDFVQRVQLSKKSRREKLSSEVRSDSVKLHISDGTMHVNRLPEKQEER